MVGDYRPRARSAQRQDAVVDTITMSALYYGLWRKERPLKALGGGTCDRIYETLHLVTTVTLLVV
jgi:hypothetical protein